MAKIPDPTTPSSGHARWNVHTHVPVATKAMDAQRTANPTWRASARCQSAAVHPGVDGGAHESESRKAT